MVSGSSGGGYAVHLTSYRRSRWFSETEVDQHASSSGSYLVGGPAARQSVLHLHLPVPVTVKTRRERKRKNESVTSKLTLGLLILCCLAGRACAQREDSKSPWIKQARVGFDDTIKVGCWTPVLLTVCGGEQGFSGQLLLRAPDSDGIPTLFATGVQSAITVAPGAEVTYWRYVKLGRTNGRILATLRNADGQVVAQHTISGLTPLNAARQWVIVLGAEVGLDEAARFLSRRSDAPFATGRLTLAAELPDRWIGWEGVDAVLVTTSEPGILEEMDALQFAALKRWVQLGGRMILSCGARAADVLDRDSRWYAFGPGPFEMLTRRWRTVGLESYIRGSQRVPEIADPSPLAVFGGVRGRVDCYESLGGVNDHPILIRYPFGFGQITFLAVDLELQPLASWGEREQLIARLIRADADDGDSSAGADRLGQVTHVGFDDLTGQLRGALDQFEGVTLVRFSWVAALLVAYILFIGPLDFLGLRKLGRPHWTWVTFPLMVTAACLIAYQLAHHLKGFRSKTNQVEIVDVDVEQALVRGTMWANLYSPEAEVPDIQVRPASPLVGEPQDSDVVVSWQGLPGNGLGGMDTSARVGQLSDGYTVFSGGSSDQLQQPAIRELPVHTASSKAIVARWWLDLPELGEYADLQVGEGGLLYGHVVNPLDVELSNCAVYFDNWAYRLNRRLGPGDRVDLDFESPLDLRWQLTRRRLVDASDVSTPWDRADFSDVRRILEMMMFHRAAGGRNYTRLGDGYQQFVDLTHQLKLGRAILVGRVQKPAAELRRDGRDVRDELDVNWTYYRVAFPVKSRASVDPEL